MPMREAPGRRRRSVQFVSHLAGSRAGLQSVVSSARSWPALARRIGFSSTGDSGA